MPLVQITTTVLLCLLAATIILASSIARDADWWAITRGKVHGKFERWTHLSRGHQQH